MTINSSRHSREYCNFLDNYYESIQIDVSQSGNYTFSSISKMNPVGYLYKQHFNPRSLSERLLFYNKEGCSSNQFKIIAKLQSNVTYILIVSVSFVGLDNFLLLVSGPGNVSFNKISTFSAQLAISS